MSQPYVGEIRLFAGNFAPQGWMFCDGQLVPIAEYETLFNLIGTTYGGDGQTSFALPDLRGRVPVHQGAGPGLSNYTIGELGGVESVTLTAAQLPAHSHTLRANSAPASNAAGPSGVLAAGKASLYGSGPPTDTLAGIAVSPVGASQSHDNMAPFGTVSYIISLFGIFPSPF